jgi:FAD/FMN-containing dehydrogenase
VWQQIVATSNRTQKVTKRIDRRSALKLAGIGALCSALPGCYTQARESDADVQFLFKSDQHFDHHRALFNKRIEILPQVIAVCESALGVQKAVRYANSLPMNISVKSGGHCFEGFSIADGGMVIDLSKMNNLELVQGDVLIAEPAARLAQLYGYCLPKGRLLPSGSCGTVGLAGVTLGGGYGLFARQYGLTCDHLIGVQMVTVEGQFLDSDDFPELLWACRGGGNGNFGVVTQLRYNTVAAPETLYQHRFRSYKLNAKRAVYLASAWFEQCEDLPNHAFSAFVLNGTTLTIMLTATKRDAKMDAILADLDRLMDSNAGLKPDPLAVGVKYYYGHSEPLNFKNISAGYYNGFDDIKACIEPLFDLVATTPGMVFQINTLGGEINNTRRSAGAAYAHRNAGYLGEAQCYWNKQAAEAHSLLAMGKVQNMLHENGVTAHYVNYPDVNIVDHNVAYYGQSYERLKALKQKLDPGNALAYRQGLV